MGCPSSYEDGTIAGYNVEYTQESLGWDFADSLAVFASGDTVTTDIDDLNNGTSYDFRVQAADGPWSNVANATPGVPSAPPRPWLTLDHSAD